MSEHTEIVLPSGLVAIIDSTDESCMAGRQWAAHKGRSTWYVRAVGNGPYLHRLLLDAPRGVLVDHCNRNGLDNRRNNLRLATNSQNAANAIRRSDNASGYKGVCWDRDRGQWRAYITEAGRLRHLGLFGNIAEAAHAYDVAAENLWGEFARPNSTNI